MKQLRREEAWRRLKKQPAVEEVRDAGPGDIPNAEGEGAMRSDPRIQRGYTHEETAEIGSIRSAR